MILPAARTSRPSSLRYGVFGGTFDPPHYGHLRAAEVAREGLQLDEVMFVPAARPPHKSTVSIAACRHRVAMLRAAISGNDDFAVSTLEIDRDGPSYTIDTLDRLSVLYPERNPFFIIGSDAFADLHTWKQWQRLLGAHRLIVLARPGSSLAVATQVIPSEMKSQIWTSPFGDLSDAQPGVYVIEAPLLRVSATAIRQRVGEARSIRYLVPAAVERYIDEQRLYRRTSAVPGDSVQPGHRASSSGKLSEKG